MQANISQVPGISRRFQVLRHQYNIPDAKRFGRVHVGDCICVHVIIHIRVLDRGDNRDEVVDDSTEQQEDCEGGKGI